MVPNIFQITCLKKASRQHIFSSMDIPLLHDESHFDLSPKDSLYTWEEKIGDILMRKHLVLLRSLSHEDATGGEEAIQFYPYVALGQATLGWEDCNNLKLACS